MSDETAVDASPAAPEPSTEAETETSRRRRLVARLPRVKADIVAAVVTWLIGTPLAVLFVRAADLDPFSTRGVIMPIAVGSAVAGAILVAWLLTRRSEMLVGVGAGAFASWVALTIAAALHGTPYGIAGLFGDAGRLSSLATRFTATWQSSDSVVHTLPSEYPPLYPWLVGHVANLLNRPAWELMGDAQVITMSVAVLLAYLMWRLLVGPRTAFVIIALVPAGFAAPNLDYEVISLLILIPWALATFGASKWGVVRLHWLPAGLIGGLIVSMYPAFLAFSMLGLLTIVGVTLWFARPRLPYLLHLVGVTGVALVVASWYVIPYAATLLGSGGAKVADMYLPGNIARDPLVFPFLDLSPLGLVQLIGLFGLFWYRRSWWGLPLLAVEGGVIAYRVFYLVRTVSNGHTGFLAHTGRIISDVLVIAGVLTVSTAAPFVLERLRAHTSRIRDLTAVACVALVAWSAVQGWESWMPAPRGVRDASSFAPGINATTYAHIEALPNGKYPKYAPPIKQRIPYFPAPAVRRVITDVLGDDAHPIVLCGNQRLYAFYPYYGFVTPDRTATNSLQKWDERHDALERLAAITDPTTFVQASQHTGFGPIDVFVLHEGNSAWAWRDVHFSPQSFSEGFHVEHIAEGFVVAVRLP